MMRVAGRSNCKHNPQGKLGVNKEERRVLDEETRGR